MKTLEINTDLMQKVHDKIKSDPDSHNQATWAVVINDPSLITKRRSGRLIVACPSTACVAGWACQIVGDVGVIENVRIDLLDPTARIQIDRVVPKGGNNKLMDIQDRAADLLGLTSEQSVELFAPRHKRQDVLSMLRRTIAYKKTHPDKNVLVGATGKHHLP